MSGLVPLPLNLFPVSLGWQIAEFEEELERLLAVQTEREQLDAEEYSLLLEQAGFPTHEVPSLSCLHFFFLSLTLLI